MIEIAGVRMRPTLAEHMDRWWGLFRGQLLKDVAELTVKQAQERVETTKQTPDGQTWPPRTSGGDHPLLVDTGDMLRSIRKRRAGRSEYHAGAAAPYAGYQDAMRQFIGVGQQDGAEIEDLIDTFVRLRF